MLYNEKQPQAIAGSSARLYAARGLNDPGGKILEWKIFSNKKGGLMAALFDELDSSFNRGAYGANPRARTTRNTGFGVNNILTVALGNCTDGAFTLAGATADALICDNISHIKKCTSLFLKVIVL